MNLNVMLEKTAKNYASKAAIIMGEQRVSYAELDEAANKVANTLIKMGVNKGDRVAIGLPNNPEFVTTYFGAIKAGGIPVPLDIRLKIEELASLLNNCKPWVLVTDSSVMEPLLAALNRFDFIKHVVDAAAVPKSTFPSYQEIMASSSARRVDIELAPDDIATISYAGGPTSHPQGAMLSHRNLVTALNAYADGFHQTEKDMSVLFALPMYHVFGLASVMLTSINKGSTVVIVPGTGRSINSFLETIERERATICLGVPYIYALAVNVARHEGVKHDLSSLRVCASAAAHLPVNVIHQFKQYYGLTITDIWGLTEAISHVTCWDSDDKNKLGAAGKPLPGWEVKIVGDNGDELPADRQGEIIVKGLIMTGYDDNPQTTAGVIRNDWLHTGDIGKIDGDGYLYITGRKKPMIILKGQNVYPVDIEKALSTHPKIARAKIIGVPDQLRGETVRAIIVLKEGETATEQEIRQFCQPIMADYKLPKEIIFAEAMPQTEETYRITP